MIERSYQVVYEQGGVRVPEINRRRKQSLYKKLEDAKQSLISDGWTRQTHPINGRVYYDHKDLPDTIALIITLSQSIG